MLKDNFFKDDPQKVAIALLGKVLRRRINNQCLSAKIIETEAYYLKDKASHASLGYTEKRRALFMPAGTIYMYYARGGDSLNISCEGEGNAVLIKSALPYIDHMADEHMIATMQANNPKANGSEPRLVHKLCSGQTLLCKAMQLRVKEWDQKNCDSNHFYIEDVGDYPEHYIQTIRLGIPEGRDEHLQYRFIDKFNAHACTSNPLRKRNWAHGEHYHILSTHCRKA